MGFRDSLKFGLWLAVIVGAFLCGAAVGAGLSYQIGYDDAWENREFHYRDHVLPGRQLTPADFEEFRAKQTTP